MKQTRILVTAVLAVGLPLGLVATEFHVARSGSDAMNGSASHPFATPHYQ